MYRLLLQVALTMALGWAASGCASLAVKPPTPADDIPPRQDAAVAAVPGERSFVLVFGSQTTPKRAKYTHSWATVVKVSRYDSPEAFSIQHHTISWMPASLDIRPLSFRVEPGINLSLRDTIDEMLRSGQRISVWGPYEVIPGMAERFQVQKAFLESGRVGYQCIDNIGEAARTGGGCDCIHAITDMDPLFDRSRYPLSYFGDAASLHIVHEIHTRPLVIDPEADHGWLLSPLGLNDCTIERQSYRGRSVPYTPENHERYLRRRYRTRPTAHPSAGAADPSASPDTTPTSPNGVSSQGE